MVLIHVPCLAWDLELWYQGNPGSDIIALVCAFSPHPNIHAALYPKYQPTGIGLLWIRNN